MHCEGLRSVDGRREHLLSLRKGLEAGLPPPKQVGVLSLYAKTMLSHGPGHLHGDPLVQIFPSVPKRWKMKPGDSHFGAVMQNKNVCGHLILLLSCQNI